MKKFELKIPPRSACNATVLRMASRKLSHLYDVALAPIGVRGTQFSMLAELGRRQNSPPTMTELAQTLVMDRSTLGQNMVPLERDGLVAQRRDVQDGRIRRSHLTDKGRATLAAGLPLWQDVQGRFENAMGNTQSAELRKILLEIISNGELDD